MVHRQPIRRRDWLRMLTATAAILGTADFVEAASPTGSQIHRIDLTDIDGRPAAITAMAVSPSAGWICVGTADDRLQLIDAASMEIAGAIVAHRDRIRSVCFSPDGDRIASVGNDGQLIVWAVDKIRGLRRVQVIGQTPSLARVAFSPDGGRIIAVGFTNAVYVLGRNGNASGQMTCSHTDMRGLTHDVHGRLIVAGRAGRAGRGGGGAVHVFDRDGTDPPRPSESFAKPSMPRLTNISLPSGAAVGLDAGSDVGDHEIRQCRTNPGTINDVATLPSDGRLVCVCDRGIVSQYDGAGNAVDIRLRIGTGRLFAVEPIDSHRVAVAGSDDVIRVVDLSSRRLTQSLRGHHGSVVDLAMMDGRLISAGYDATVRTWRLDR